MVEFLLWEIWTFFNRYVSKFRELFVLLESEGYRGW